MNKKKEGLQLGNFILKREQSNGHEWINIKAVSGFWSMRFRDDNLTYAIILDMARNKDFREYLETWIKMCYLVSSTVPDLQFLQEFYAGYTAMSERFIDSRNAASDEDDKNALEDVRLSHEIESKKKEFEKEEREASDEDAGRS